MNLGIDILAYNNSLDGPHRQIAEGLCSLVASEVPDANGKVWHGHPVWFIDENPVFGYSIKKAGFEVLFWSGQSLAAEGLRAIGKFQAAGVVVPELSEDMTKKLKAWLKEAQSKQWNYKNLPKVGKLEKLSNF